ncbi:DUF4286 family protein [Sphingobacterium composti Ten et al. 2007 non Yoo et al. 2007]|uniref:DUF4286 family protein n=1 Tax=Sphingobacterium composti TaxID=363260 RepID=UPI00135BB4D3|nr:DUF4286 family protein [Sphingobacterium composti Ten et al. 2007 non Yoo et al. 2007]
MYLYNISIIVDNDRHEILIQWVKENWLNTLPNQAKFLKLLDSPHEGQTYCVQLVFEHPSDIPTFQKEKLAMLQGYIAENHLEKAFLFDSTMKYL